MNINELIELGDLKNLLHNVLYLKRSKNEREEVIKSVWEDYINNESINFSRIFEEVGMMAGGGVVLGYITDLATEYSPQRGRSWYKSVILEGNKSEDYTVAQDVLKLWAVNVKMVFGDAVSLYKDNIPHISKYLKLMNYADMIFKFDRLSEENINLTSLNDNLYLDISKISSYNERLQSIISEYKQLNCIQRLFIPLED